MKTKIIYVLIASEKTLFLEEFWVSLFSLRNYHPEAHVTVLTDGPTAKRVRERKKLLEMVTELQVVDVPNEYNDRLRSRTIKTSVRNLIDGDYLYIDTDTVITESLDEIDNLPIKNLAMVPELHGPFCNHFTYNYVCNDVRRIFDTDVSDSPYWFNAGCTFVRDNVTTRDFFTRWHKNWEYSAFQKGVTSDMRSLIYTDKTCGYIIECLPDVFNSQVAMSLKYFHKAKIVHFWHMRSDFYSDASYSPFTDKSIYKSIKEEGDISEENAAIILNCKESFRPMSMVVGHDDIRLLFSPLYTVLFRSYLENRFMHWLLDVLIKIVHYSERAKHKLLGRNK